MTCRDRIDQTRPLAGQAQGRLRQVSTLHRTHILPGDLWIVTGTDEGLIVFEQRVVLFAGTIQGVAQGHPAGDVIGLGRHQRSGSRHRLVGLVGVSLVQRHPQLHFLVVRFDGLGLVVDPVRIVPAPLVAVSPRSGGQGCNRQVQVASLGFIDLDHFGVQAGPTGDLQVVADLTGGGLARRHLTQRG
ncbi:hypothetical protein D3C84_769480 [compost metagenome]